MNIPVDMSSNMCLEINCSVKRFKSLENRTTALLEVIYTIIYGPYWHSLTIKSRYIFEYFMKNKFEVFEKFKEFKL